MSIIDTIGNEQWLRANESKIKDMLPETWTHMQNINVMKLGFQMKLLGIDWRTYEEAAKVMMFLERVGFLVRDGKTVKRNNQPVFKTAPNGA